MSETSKKAKQPEALDQPIRFKDLAKAWAEFEPKVPLAFIAAARRAVRDKRR
jgi:hypothetical protein